MSLDILKTLAVLINLNKTYNEFLVKQNYKVESKEFLN